jgi:hypothetical protein
MDLDRKYHVALIMERAAMLALLEAAPDEVSELNLDLLEMSDLAPFRAALRAFIDATVATMDQPKAEGRSEGDTP